MVHQGQGLPLGLEAGDHLPGIHARLDDLERDAAADRRLLVGHEDHAHAAFADLLQQLVRTDERAGPLGQRRLGGRQVDRGAELGGRLFQEAVRIVVGLEQGLDPRAESGVAADGLVQERGPLGRRLLAGSQEDRFHVVRVGHFAILSLRLHVLSMLCDVSAGLSHEIEETL